jgi:periplasmic protein TonB
MTNRKKPGADLRNYYTLFWELGLLATLVLCFIMVRIDFSGAESREYEVYEPEVIELKEIVQVRTIETPPVPPRPPVPVEVPEDEIIEDVEIDISFDHNYGNILNMPKQVASDINDPDEQVFQVVEHMPELIGGLGELQRQIRYPEVARRARIEGKVFIEFIVNERGEVENPRVVRGIGGGADEEALRVVSQAQFKPGMQQGRPVRVQLSLPVFFRLQK